ncbi:FAD-dependent oxidoreductase [Shinella sp.]|uniref:FAD-dependent oxidoreductase n=1 Tax=Shinella sp. TaxID=1870904 RepID=UPI00403558D3
MNEFDVVVIGSGSAACAAALRSAKGGLKVLVLEKSAQLGGTSAMSGAGIWIPANHVAAAAGVADSRQDALAYLHAVQPPELKQRDSRRWAAFVEAAPDMLQFLAENTPLEFQLVAEPDPFTEAPGGKVFGRMVTPRALSRRLLGRFTNRLRRSTLPHSFTYKEAVDLDIYHHPIKAGFKVWHKLLRRWLTNSGGQGTALMVGLIKGCLDAGVEFRLEARAVQLVRDAEGRINGVDVEQTGQTQRIEAARGVVIASGGFEWNPEMVARHFPGPIDRIGSPSSNEGDGQQLAALAGAALSCMDQANIYPCLPTRYERRPSGLPMTFQAEPHSIMVNRHGKRFVSESDFNIGEALDARDENGAPVNLPCFLVGDHRFLGAALPFRWYASYDPGWVKKAETVQELAQKLGLPAEALEETITRWNAHCKTGRDTDFQRGENSWEAYKAHGEATRLKPIDKPPYIGMTLNRSILGTKGGATTNERGQVLREDGSIIAGLYAAGLAMANPFGTRAIGAGTTLGPNMTWGYIAAETILQQNR